MRAVLLSVVVLALPCAAAEVELFVDRGETFIRAGSDAGVQRGTSLPVLGARTGNSKERRRVGTATVMEVWPALARVSLDEAARADKSSPKYVAVNEAQPAVAPPPPPLPPPPPPPPSGGLRGHARFGGAGPWTAVQVFNDGEQEWTRCELTLVPNQIRYTLPRLIGNDHEVIAVSNFSAGPRDPTPRELSVRCREGQATFPLP